MGWSVAMGAVEGYRLEMDPELEGTVVSDTGLLGSWVRLADWAARVDDAVLESTKCAVVDVLLVAMSCR